MGLVASANWRRLADFMLSAFQDADPNVRLQAVKILENYIKGESVSRIESLPVSSSGLASSPSESVAVSPGTSPGRVSTSRWLYNAQVRVTSSDATLVWLFTPH